MADNKNYTDSPFIVQIRDQSYYIEIYLYNQLEGYPPVKVPFLFVNSFSINESLIDWITKGWIILRSDFEIFERGSNSTTVSQNNNQITLPAIKAPYVFRTDGRNKISFRIYPVDPTNGADVYPHDMWEMSFDFSIYDIEDIQTGNNQQKLKKLYFWDERFQILSERNIEYSTVYSSIYRKKIPVNTGGLLNNVGSTLTAASLTDSQRSINPSLALQDIIMTAASVTPTIRNNPFTINQNQGDFIKVGFLESESIDSPTQSMARFDNKNWDIGIGSNYINYSSPANSTALDDIKYALDRCIGLDNGPVLLNFGRSSLDKTWKLNSLSNFFSNANKNQIERLFIEDGAENGQPSVSRAPNATNDKNTVNFSSAIASRIFQYSFSPMVAMDSARITNAPVHTYDFSTNQFNIKYTGNRAIDVKDNLEKLAKTGLFNFSSSHPNPSGAGILLNINETNKKGIHLKNIFVPSRYFPPNYSGAKMLKDAIFLNETLTFKVKGITMRTPGKFIFIDRLGSSGGDKNPFDDRVLGQWLIVKVNHIFSQDDYNTEVVAVKIDSWSNLFVKDNCKY